MRLIGVLAVLGLLLCGCGSTQTFETVSDVWQAETVQAQHVVLELPEDAAAEVMESGDGELYLCDGYEIAVQTMAAGDLTRTVQQMSGFSPDELTVIQTSMDELTRYELVWSSAGENGDRICRGVILDDGNYHYAVSVMADAQDTESMKTVWETVFSSLRLRQY